MKGAYPYRLKPFRTYQGINMPFHKLFITFCLIGISVCAAGQYSISGRVLAKRDSTPVVGATISLLETDMWATTDAKGFYRMEQIPKGVVTVSVSSLNYVKVVHRLFMQHDIKDTIFFLEEDNLSLDEVVVTASVKKNIATTYSIDRKALDHIQMLSVTDAASLLPGGTTNKSTNLTSGAQNFAVNGVSGERGNAIFGVGVEVDGVRLSANALPGTSGVDVRNVASTNVESIEIITGVPSVTYGDASNGIVKINTSKGKTPYLLDLLTKPNTKQIALSKGFGLGKKVATLNVSFEHTKSVSNIASPYTAYSRNSVTLNYSNTFNRNKRKPILLNLGLAGNTGGYNTKADPDQFVNTYSKAKDDIVRGNLSLKWLLNKKWITNLEFTTSANYNDKKSETSSNKSASSSVAAIHAMQQGYFVGQLYSANPSAEILLIPPGYWYQILYNDSKALNYTGSFKMNLAKRWGIVSNNILLGGDYNVSQNNGRGSYYNDLKYAPTWRPYRYDQESAIHNYAYYIEDKLKIPVKSSSVQVVGGLRQDITHINGSEYGTVSSLSPRVNAQFTFWERKRKLFSDLNVRAGWGKMVKLPSFNILYAVPDYRDILAFAPGTTSQGETFYAYYSMPYTRLFNPDLKWQYTIQKELAIETKLQGTALTIILSKNTTYHSFDGINKYEPFTYKLTDQSNLQNSQIPINNRIYSIDKITGIVTVSDKTGVRSPEVLTYRQFTRFNGNSMSINGWPVTRNRLSWIIDFKQIRLLRTSLRLDGSYYSYQSIDEVMKGYIPNTTQLMADGNPYKYIGYYAGGASSANGEKTKNVNLNFSVITHIPSLKLVVSARMECSLYDYAQNLSEYQGNERGFILDSRDNYLPSTTQSDIYGGNRFVGLYPQYYVSLDDLNKPIPFAEKFLWAKQNDPALYNELAKLVIRTNYNYYFNPNKTSIYFSGNINVTKELRRWATITFNARNFLNNMALVHSTWSSSDYTLYGSGNIPATYYGITLRLKF